MVASKCKTKVCKKPVVAGKKRRNMKPGGKPIMGKGLVNNLKCGKDGIYVYRKMINGKVRTGTTGEHEYEKAVKALTIITSDYLKDDLGTTKKKAPIFEQAVKEWATNKKGTVTDQYITNCVNLMKIHFVPVIGTKFIDKIGKSDLRGCLQTYLASTQGNKEVKCFGGHNQILTILHSIFKEMKDCKYMSTYEGVIPEYVYGQKKIKRYVKEEDIDAILKIMNDRFGIYKYTATVMGMFLGLRSIEVVKAKWGMIDWVDKTFSNWDTKGNECDAIPMSDEVIQAFKRLKTLREADGTKLVASDYIILNEEGLPAIRAFHRYALTIAGKEVLGHILSSHDMRRTFIMYMYRAGEPLETIRKCARHSKIETTLEYIQVDQNDKKAAINNVFNRKRKTHATAQEASNVEQLITA